MAALPLSVSSAQTRSAAKHHSLQTLALARYRWSQLQQQSAWYTVNPSNATLSSSLSAPLDQSCSTRHTACLQANHPPGATLKLATLHCTVHCTALHCATLQAAVKPRTGTTAIPSQQQLFFEGATIISVRARIRQHHGSQLASSTCNTQPERRAALFPHKNQHSETLSRSQPTGIGSQRTHIVFLRS